ncbi:sigma-70 family RNA polymerase sigma factor [Kitasatospora paracochleata]|uniref:RNA polymerase sigma factor n=1 Tax=Kitasatospora paracochleata TaxID=58354 RepID=A0ABT1J3F9_9ACTN|nr:sigma-70 family RNA polymerase sigma factor [Kitasatospora paracochleata]MCP2311596.1 RNA polymerase sigma-70 factor (ECF subfamily) [Kitasatospora paracochleata]
MTELAPDATRQAEAAATPRMTTADFTRLVTAHHRAVHGYLAKRTFGDPQLAEDLTQEAFVRAWHHPEILAAKQGTPLPWLYRVARNLLIDHLRARSSRPAEVGTTDLTVFARESELGSDIDRLLNNWSVRQALSSLSDAHRTVITEVYFNHRSLAEAAEVLGLPEGTAKSRCFYAIRALRLALSEHGLLP